MDHKYFRPNIVVQADQEQLIGFQEYLDNRNSICIVQGLENEQQFYPNDLLVVYVIEDDKEVEKIKLLQINIPVLIIYDQPIQEFNCKNFYQLRYLDFSNDILFEKVYQLIKLTIIDLQNLNEPFNAFIGKVLNMSMNSSNQIVKVANEYTDTHNINFISAILISIDLYETQSSVKEQQKQITDILNQQIEIYLGSVDRTMKVLYQFQYYLQIIVDLKLIRMQKSIFSIYDLSEIVIYEEAVQFTMIKEEDISKECNILSMYDDIFNHIIKNNIWKNDVFEINYLFDLVFSAFKNIQNCFFFIQKSLGDEFTLLKLQIFLSIMYQKIDGYGLLNGLKISRILYQITQNTLISQKSNDIIQEILNNQRDILLILGKHLAAQQINFMLNLRNPTDCFSPPMTPRSIRQKQSFPITQLFLGQKYETELLDSQIIVKPKESSQIIDDIIQIHPISLQSIKIYYFRHNFDIEILMPFSYKIQILPLNYYILRSQSIENIHYNRFLVKFIIKPNKLTKFQISHCLPENFIIEQENMNFSLQTDENFIDFYIAQRKDISQRFENNIKVGQLDYQFDDIIGTFPVFTAFNIPKSNFSFQQSQYQLLINTETQVYINFHGIGFYDFLVEADCEIIGKQTFKGFNMGSCQFQISLICRKRQCKVLILGKIKDEKRSYDLEYYLFDGVVQ